MTIKIDLSELPKWSTALVATAAFVVAYLQWRAATTRLRLDLYDRRYKVFDGVKEFLASVVGSGKVSNDARAKFYRDSASAQFLFGEDLIKYIGEVRENGNQHTFAQGTISKPNDPGFNAAVDRESVLNIWFGEQLFGGGLENAFRKYLDFRDIR